MASIISEAETSISPPHLQFQIEVGGMLKKWQHAKVKGVHFNQLLHYTGCKGVHMLYMFVCMFKMDATFRRIPRIEFSLEY